MNRSPAPDGFESLENDLQALRRRIQDGSDPKAMVASAALSYVDSIARIRRCWDRFDTAMEWELYSPRFSFEENVRRMRKAFPIRRRLTSLLMRQIDGLLKCVGGPVAIAVQIVLESVGMDSNRQQVALQFLSAFIEVAKVSRRKRKAA